MGLIAVAAAGRSDFLLPGGPCIVSNLEGGGAFEGATHIITNVVTLPDWYFAGGDGEDAIHAAPSGMLERDLERGSGARYLPPAIGPL